MTGKCAFCWAWALKPGEGQYTGYCLRNEKFTTRSESCADSSLIPNINPYKGKSPYEAQQQLALIKNVPDWLKQSLDFKDIKPVSKTTTAVNSWVSNDDLKEECTLTLYKHQQEAVEYFDDKTEIALFMECGTGKSATVLEIVARKFKRHEIDQLLIIAPNDVHRQWYVEQLPLWLGVPYEAQCLFGRGGQRNAYPFERDAATLKVVCVNIDTFSTQSKWQDITEWANAGKTFIVLDEATVIKNINAQRTKHVLYEFNKTLRKGKSIIASQSNSVARAVLTGTPVTNGAMDLWAIMEFLRPNFFGRNYYSFKSHFGMFTKIDINGHLIEVPLTHEWWMTIKSINSFAEANAICGCSEDTFNTIHAQTEFTGPYKHADELRELIAPVSKFALLKECVDMPEEIYIPVQLIMSSEIRECYDSMTEQMIAQYETHTATALNKMTMLIRQQQISSGFICDKTIDLNSEDVNNIGTLWQLSDDVDYTPEDSIKWIGNTNPKLEQLYRDIEEISKPVIVVTRFTAEASRIYNDLSSKHRTCLITGWKRVGSIEEFKQGKYDVMVCNIAAMARGHNLQVSHSMIIYSNTFSLELWLQLIGRIYRTGQRHPCEYRMYIYNDSVDEKISQSLLLKRKLLDYVRGVDVKEMLAA